MVEIELLISSEIGFQVGLDYCNNSYDYHMVEPHLEIPVSKWYGDTKGEFITIRYHDYENPPGLDRNTMAWLPMERIFL